MIVYRIVSSEFLNECLSGEGAFLYGGRWNNKKTRIVYTSETRSLSLLELLVHLDLTEDLPSDKVIVEIHIDASVKVTTLDLHQLEKGWDQYPTMEITKQIGDHFVKANNSLLLKVPSCLVHEEFNYLINPAHPDFNRVKIYAHKRLNIDTRFSKI